MGKVGIIINPARALGYPIFPGCPVEITSFTSHFQKTQRKYIVYSEINKANIHRLN
jgi:hypothetical protein